MSTYIEHIVRLTDHRDRDLLELTLSKALIDLLPVDRIVIARVAREEGKYRIGQVFEAVAMQDQQAHQHAAFVFATA